MVRLGFMISNTMQNLAVPLVFIGALVVYLVWLFFLPKISIASRRLRASEVVVANLPLLVRYTVVLDGLANAGKTSLVERLMAPHIPFVTLSRSTKVTYSADCPVAWKKGASKRSLFCINFIDIPGESQHEFYASVGNIKSEFGILTIVVSAESSEQLDNAIERRLNKDYIKGIIS